MSTQLQEAQKIAELATERAKLFEALEANAEDLSSLGIIVSGGEKPKAATAKKTTAAATASSPASSTSSKPKAKRGRGRPKGSKNKSAAAKKKKGPKTKAAASTTSTDTKIEAGDLDLPDLLTMIAQQVASPLKHPDFLKLVLASGYKSEAKDKSNMVYQSLNKLVKRGTLTKDPDSREYNLVADAA